MNQPAQRFRSFLWRCLNGLESRAGDGLLLALAAVLLWSGNFIAAKAVADTVPAMALAFWRWSFAALIAILFAWRHLRQDWPVLVRHWRMVTLLAFLGNACYSALIYVGLQTTSAITVMLENAILPAAIAVLCYLVHGERMRPVQIWGLGFSLAGAVWIIVRGDLDQLTALTLARGDFLVIGGVVAYAAYTVLLSRAPPVHSASLIAATFAAAAVLLVPFFLGELILGAPTHWPVEGWLAIVYIAVFPSLVCFSLFNAAIRKIGANRAGIMLSFLPVAGAGLAFVLLGERLTGAHMVGGTLVLGGVLLAQRRTGR
ncbi:MAG: DMT family transporter [Alphaproteobacteria bacterium]|nr:MAG: DMT family transporter [Alphaproteobacteria bacterium]